MNKKSVLSIKKDLEAGVMTQKEIGEKYGCSRSTVSDIATGRLHKDVGPTMIPKRISSNSRNSLSIEQRNVALIGEVENLRAERNILRRQLKASAKREFAIDSVLDSIRPNIVAIPRPKPLPLKKKTTIDETLVLLLSDNHADQVVSPEEVEGLERYDFPIAVRRHEVLVEEMLKFTRESLVNFNFRKLVVLGMGDFTSGQIHGHVNRSYFHDQFTSDLAIGELFGQMLGELSQYFESMDVVTVTGNHGRLTEAIEYTKDGVAANHDTLIMRIAELHCKNMKNINFEFPIGLSHLKNIEGWNFHVHHGHGKKGSGETWARAKRKSQTIVPLHKGNVHYFVSGHFHTPGEVSVSGGATLIGNGAFLACDPYSVQALEEANEPSQMIFGVHRHHGVTWRLPVKVRTRDEGAGPQRYLSSYAKVR